MGPCCGKEKQKRDKSEKPQEETVAIDGEEEIGGWLPEVRRETMKEVQ